MSHCGPIKEWKFHLTSLSHRKYGKYMCVDNCSTAKCQRYVAEFFIWIFLSSWKHQDLPKIFLGSSYFRIPSHCVTFAIRNLQKSIRSAHVRCKRWKFFSIYSISRILNWHLVDWWQLLEFCGSLLWVFKLLNFIYWRIKYFKPFIEFLLKYHAKNFLASFSFLSPANA